MDSSINPRFRHACEPTTRLSGKPFSYGCFFVNHLTTLKADSVVLDVEASTYAEMVNALVGTMVDRGVLAAKNSTRVQHLLLLHDMMHHEHYRTEDSRDANKRIRKESSINHIVRVPEFVVN